MCGVGVVDFGTRSLAAMVAMVANPRFAEDNFAEAVFPSGDAAVEIILSILIYLVSGVVEGVCCGSEANDGFACHEVIVDIAHLFRREFTEAGKNDHQVGVFQGLEPRYVGLLIGVYFATSGV